MTNSWVFILFITSWLANVAAILFLSEGLKQENKCYLATMIDFVLSKNIKKQTLGASYFNAIFFSILLIVSN